MAVIKRIKRWLRERQVMRHCGCICYCPECREILNDWSPNYGSENGLFVTYICRVCGCESRWDYGFPVPVFIGRVE